MPTVDQILGYGLIHPFRFDGKEDFLAAGGVELVRSSVKQILGTFSGEGARSTARGELRWRTDFGSPLHALRHRPNNAWTRELARTWVIEKLGKWEPRVRVTAVTFEQRDSDAGRKRNVMLIHLQYDIAATSRPGSAVVATGIVQTVSA